jgi:hypothetical protein
MTTQFLINLIRLDLQTKLLIKKIKRKKIILNKLLRLMHNLIWLKV